MRPTASRQCTTRRSAGYCLRAAGKASWAANRLANSVAPPSVGDFPMSAACPCRVRCNWCHPYASICCPLRTRAETRAIGSCCWRNNISEFVRQRDERFVTEKYLGKHRHIIGIQSLLYSGGDPFFDDVFSLNADYAPRLGVMGSNARSTMALLLLLYA